MSSPDLPGISHWCQYDKHDECGGSPGCKCECHQQKPAHVSHSRVEAYLQCQRKEYYSYGMKLQLKKGSLALNLGSTIHSCLEVLYRHVLSAGANLKRQREAYPQAVEKMWKHVDELYRTGWTDNEKRASLRQILEGYLAREPFIDNEWSDDSRQWLVLAVEKEFNFEYAPGERYPFVVDLILKDPRGRLVVVDHKGTYDFYSEIEVALKPQIPKYIGALRALGYKIHSGMYNMLRTRPAPVKTKRKPEEWAKTLPVEATPARIERTIEDQLVIAGTLMDLDKLNPEEREQTAVRSAAGTDICSRMCDFRELCNAQLNGDNTQILMKNLYQIKPKRAKIEVSTEADD